MAAWPAHGAPPCAVPGALGAAPPPPFRADSMGARANRGPSRPRSDGGATRTWLATAPKRRLCAQTQRPLGRTARAPPPSHLPHLCSTSAGRRAARRREDLGGKRVDRAAAGPPQRWPLSLRAGALEPPVRTRRPAAAVRRPAAALQAGVAADGFGSGSAAPAPAPAPSGLPAGRTRGLRPLTRAMFLDTLKTSVRAAIDAGPPAWHSLRAARRVLPLPRGGASVAGFRR